MQVPIFEGVDSSKKKESTPQNSAKELTLATDSRIRQSSSGQQRKQQVGSENVHASRFSNTM